MSFGRVARLTRWLAGHFPERHLYVRSGGEMRAYVLTPERQLAIATFVGVTALWLGVCTAAMLAGLLRGGQDQGQVAQVEAKYERWIADRQARLNSAVSQLNASSSSIDQLANTMERRHAALAMLLTDEGSLPGAQHALGPLLAQAIGLHGSPAQRIEALRMDQEQLIEAAGSFAKNRADRLRMAFRLAGLDPSLYVGRGDALGGPLIDARDPRALGAILDVDPDFARRIQVAAADLSDMRGLSASAMTLPMARPAADAAESSGFGIRIDPFTGAPAFHSGQDFAGAFLSPITATAPGVISFTGVRSGYGQTVEIDHGRGFKTRYAHLASIFVTVGQHVALGQKIGAMGSTGRSTGTHLHYEVWVDGRPQNPLRFVKAGEYVQQNSD